MIEEFIGTAYRVGNTSIALTIPEEVAKKMKAKVGSRLRAKVELI